MEAKVHTFCNSAIDGNEWSASCSDCFIPEERAHGTNRIGPRASLDVVAMRKILLLLGKILPLSRIKPWLFIPYPVTILSRLP
jgi:hypothetical protein